MNHIVTSPLLWAALVVLLIVRQFLPQAVRPRTMLLLPLVAGYFGLQALTRTPPDGVLAIALLGLNLVVAAGLGGLRGATIRLWRDASGAWMSQGTVLTLLLWIGLVVARVGLIVLAHGTLPVQEIALFVGVTFGAQSLVLWVRMQGAAAGRALVR